MKSAAVVALALLESAQAFQAPALKAARSVSKVSMFSEGDIGVLPPLGVYDPLGLIDVSCAALRASAQLPCLRAARGAQAG